MILSIHIRQVYFNEIFFNFFKQNVFVRILHLLYSLNAHPKIILCSDYLDTFIQFFLILFIIREVSIEWKEN